MNHILDRALFAGLSLTLALGVYLHHTPLTIATGFVFLAYVIDTKGTPQ